MTVYVALLRGINVGGRSTLPMAQLRQVATECGFGAVRTYIQSGNLVFTSPDPAAEVAGPAGGGHGRRGRAGAAGRRCAPATSWPRWWPGTRTWSWSTDPKQLHVAFLVEGAEPVPLDGLDLDRFAPGGRSPWPAARPTCSCRTGSAAASWPRP